MRTYNATRNAWLLRIHTDYYQPSWMTLPHDASFLTDGKEIVFNRADVLTGMQILPPIVPVCFSKAVVGAGNRCGLRYCEKNIPAKYYEKFRKDVFTSIHDSQWVRNEQKQFNDSLKFACINNLKIYNPIKNNSTDIKGEKGKLVIIGILQRFYNRRIINVKELVDALTMQNYMVKYFDFDAGCSIHATAKLLQNVDILITPHGSGIGGAIFMEPKTTVISIDARFYSESWFSYAHTASGRRFYNFQCESSDCQVADFELAKKGLQKHGIMMPYHELLQYLGPEYPYRLLDKYAADYRSVYDEYAKDAMRRVEVEKLVRFVNEIVEEMPLIKNMSFLELCEIGRCCGPWCDSALKRNVFWKGNAWGGTERTMDSKATSWKAGAPIAH